KNTTYNNLYSSFAPFGKQTHHTRNVRAHINRMYKKVILLIFIAGVVSCNRTYKIDESDLELIPYSGNESLVFKSSKNELDTIFLKGFGQFEVDSDPLEFFPDKLEFYRLTCKHSNPNPKYKGYIENSLMQIHRFSDSQTYIEFELSLKGTMGSCNMSKTDFEKIPITNLNINGKLYNDIKTFTSDIHTKGKLPEKYYWSISEGLIGIDDNDVKWRLIKKYVP
ncbi:hypothetical protein, partial [uncultured Aquimarina sp.]|uniref:hypothetical protein n=1 Tax=uncultured Aquimarina sp. TaxID=575652 RepID=UPI0026296FF3